jgi:enoyl-CoA hydratase
LRSLREGRQTQSLEECLAREFRAGSRIARRSDFIEGVRAAVIDKTGSPRWTPSALSDVSEKDVDSFFLPLGDRELWIAAPN